MKKWTLLDSVQTENGKTMSFHEHDGKYVIRVNGMELMSTRQHESEEEIARLVCRHLHCPEPKILIGGLGFGFTLRAALDAAPADAQVVVAEIESAVISWNSDPRFKLAADVMSDERVQVVHRDVADVLSAEKHGFDGIILDVDNGPEAFSRQQNQWLYEARGLAMIRRALRAGGCVAFWSANDSPAFSKLLKQSGYRLEVHKSRARPGSGSTHTLFLAFSPD